MLSFGFPFSFFTNIITFLALISHITYGGKHWLRSLWWGFLSSGGSLRGSSWSFSWSFSFLHFWFSICWSVRSLIIWSIWCFSSGSGWGFGRSFPSSIWCSSVWSSSRFIRWFLFPVRFFLLKLLTIPYLMSLWLWGGVLHLIIRSSLLLFVLLFIISVGVV
jgi:hypothetical protein